MKIYNLQIIISTILNETYLFEKKDGDEVRKICGNEMNCGNKLEKILEKEVKKKR